MTRLEPYTPTPAARAGRIVLLVLPFAIGIVCVLLSFVPVGAIFGTNVMPAFGFMAIYYWAVVRPEVFPPYAVFAVGFLFDLLSSGPVGLWAFVYLLTYGLVLSQRILLVNRNFGVIWLGFGLAALVAAILAWGAGSLYYEQTLPVGPILWHMGVTILLFPPFATLFERLQRRLLTSG